ncbi:MAG TPA: hypothetical protein DCG38_00165 [Eubacteriaceae bacterium]|jgi:hypothetical protein|nr:hypothetical protein [Eubacteriaceae bacterium]
MKCRKFNINEKQGLYTKTLYTKSFRKINSFLRKHENDTIEPTKDLFDIILTKIGEINHG